MDVLLGFLIGLAYPPTLVIVIASMIAGRSAAGVIAVVTALIMLSGPVVWIMTYIAIGYGAGHAAFAGWVLGLGVAGLIVVLLIASRFNRINSQPSGTVE